MFVVPFLYLHDFLIEHYLLLLLHLLEQHLQELVLGQVTRFLTEHVHALPHLILYARLKVICLPQLVSAHPLHVAIVLEVLPILLHLVHPFGECGDLVEEGFGVGADVVGTGVCSGGGESFEGEVV